MLRQERCGIGLKNNRRTEKKKRETINDSK